MSSIPLAKQRNPPVSAFIITTARALQAATFHQTNVELEQTITDFAKIATGSTDKIGNPILNFHVFGD
jgi:hypothetical protein